MLQASALSIIIPSFSLGGPTCTEHHCQRYHCKHPKRFPFIANYSPAVLNLPLLSIDQGNDPSLAKDYLQALYIPLLSTDQGTEPSLANDYPQALSLPLLSLPLLNTVLKH
jgi:hypothetical protein